MQVSIIAGEEEVACAVDGYAAEVETHVKHGLRVAAGGRSFNEDIGVVADVDFSAGVGSNIGWRGKAAPDCELRGRTKVHLRPDAGPDE